MLNRIERHRMPYFASAKPTFLSSYRLPSAIPVALRRTSIYLNLIISYWVQTRMNEHSGQASRHSTMPGQMDLPTQQLIKNNNNERTETTTKTAKGQLKYASDSRICAVTDSSVLCSTGVPHMIYPQDTNMTTVPRLCQS